MAKTTAEAIAAGRLRPALILFLSLMD